MFDNMQELMKRNPKVVELLQLTIDRKGLEYADNWRIARPENATERLFYDEVESRGCCGSFNTIITVDGEVWMIGCNYGH